MAFAVVEGAAHGERLELARARVAVELCVTVAVRVRVRVGAAVGDDERGRARLAPLGHALDALEVARVRAGADDHRGRALVLLERAARQRARRVVQDREHLHVHLLRARPYKYSRTYELPVCVMV